MDKESVELICQYMDRAYFGRLSVTQHDISVRLLSFEEPSSIETRSPVHLLLENGQVATLFDCLPFAWGYADSPHRRVWQGNLIANGALIGREPWDFAKPVRSVTFQFLESRVGLAAPAGIERQLEPGKITTTTELGMNTLARCHPKNLDVHIWSAFCGSLGSQREVIDPVPTVTIEFENEVSVPNYLVVVLEIVALFSLSIGYRSTPFAIRISSSSGQEMQAEAQQQGYSELFKAHYIGGDPPKVPANGLWAGGAVLQLITPMERRATESCIVAWLDRLEEWRAAHCLMMGSLRCQNQMDKERLMAAITWFENIPLNGLSGDITQAQLVAITDAALAEARKVGLTQNTDRVRNAIARVKQESLNQRFERLIRTIRGRFGGELVPAELENDCASAVRLRGKAAHAMLGDDEHSFVELSQAVYAVEYVSFLLMISELPFSKDAPSRLRYHPFLEYTRFKNARK